MNASSIESFVSYRASRAGGRLEADESEPESAVHRNVTTIPARGALVVVSARHG